jgi:hypothetical protein
MSDPTDQGAEPTPEGSGPTPSGSTGPIGGSGSSASQISGAVSGAMSDVMTRLQRGEQITLAGAALVVGVWVVFQLILGKFVMTNFALVIAILIVLAIWIHRWGHYDFGNGYRIVLGALGVSLALFAIINLLETFRFGLTAEALSWLGLLLYWIGGLVAGFGAWQVFRTR